MIKFDAWDTQYKTPFGAVCCGTSVTFRILADECVQVSLCTDTLGSFEMDKQPDGYFKKTITPVESGLLYYWFCLHDAYGTTFYVGKHAGGTGQCCIKDPTGFQLTVYEQTPPLPEWYTQGIVYQIFPDRFYAAEPISHAKENAYYRDWNDAPAYIRDADGNVIKWDFFGGNLKGIVQKLPYLKSLGITAIYLNPIFESASNHRYSTANFKQIDPLLGTEDDFKALVHAADKVGIKLILDGVFNHVGAESIYFNKTGRYGTDGAFQNPDSRYRNWFCFTSYPNVYNAWWGVSDLPSLDKNNPDVRAYLITDTDSVIKHWTRLGIGGWRLDVADELPDDFLALLYKTVKAHNADAIVLGEVWEDASNKIAYNTLKKYFTNRELDCVMNYPFRDNLLAFFKGALSAQQLYTQFMMQMENYPFSAFYGNLNILGTHDVERIYTCAASICEENPLALLTQLVALQFVFPGVPSIYYGDEAGLTGGKDPDNRKPFPWGKENQDIFSIYQKYTSMRTSMQVLKQGNTMFLTQGEDVFGIKRYLGTESFTLWVNRSDVPQGGIPPHGIREEIQDES